jgi:hypothetical protein
MFLLERPAAGRKLWCLVEGNGENIFVSGASRVLDRGGTQPNHDGTKLHRRQSSGRRNCGEAGVGDFSGCDQPWCPRDSQPSGSDGGETSETTSSTATDLRNKLHQAGRSRFV